MIEKRCQDLIDQGEHLFNQKQSLNSLWQEIAEQFYPERARFTSKWNMGRNFADNLTTSFPILCRRDLGNTFSQMLRPEDQQWGKATTNRPDRLDDDAKKWLERSTKAQWRAMYDQVSGFVRSMNQADHDFAAFGQDVTSCVLNRKADALVIKNWHLRDMAWSQNHEGIVDDFRRRWRPTIRDLNRMFPGGVSDAVAKAKDKEPFREIDCYHMVVPIDVYEPGSGKKPNTPYVSVFLDRENGKVMEELGSHNTIYVVRRWQTVSDSQYAYSPATIAALPDARLMQAMTLVLLEAGEKGVNPPMVAPADVIRSDMALYANGVTTYDADYDEKTGEVLRPIQTVDKGGFQFAIQMVQGVKEMLSNAFFLNKIGLPPIGRDMTAFEVGQRVSEYVRNALPLFGPMSNDNSMICELIFDVMFRAGGFGSPLDIPDSLRGQEIKFKFKTPLSAAIDSQKGQQLLQAKAMAAEIAPLDQTAPAMIDWRTAFRDALEGTDTPAAWMRSDQAMAGYAQQMQKNADMQQQLALLGQGADVGNKVGMAAQNLGLLPPPGQAKRQGIEQAVGA